MAHVRWRAVLVTIFVSGCASHQSGPASGGMGRWHGQLKQLNTSSTAVLQTSTMSQGAVAASYGQITVTPVGTAPGEDRARMRFEISVMAPSQSGNNLAWAVFSGPCNSPLPPIASVTDFPVLEINTSGAASVRVELLTALEPRGTYHANVYETGRATDVSGVLLCANLKYQR